MLLSLFGKAKPPDFCAGIDRHFSGLAALSLLVGSITVQDNVVRAQKLFWSPGSYCRDLHWRDFVDGAGYLGRTFH